MARTDTLWVKVAGSYLKPALESGLNVLIAGTNKYLNFGSTVGSSGYGLRDNGGTIQYKHSGGSWASLGSGGGGGEANTASNVGTAGVGIFKQKSVLDLQFKKLNAGSAKVTITDDTGNDEVDIDVDEAEFAVDSMVEGSTNKFMTAAERTKVGNLTVTAATDLDSIRTKAGYITVTQAVDLDAIETRVNELDAAVVLQGSWDASAGTFPGSGTAQAGQSWIVSVAGTVNSVDFEVGDRIVAITDNASTTVYASNWLKLDYTDKVTSVAGRTGIITLDADDIDDAATTNKFVTSALIALINSALQPGDVDDVPVNGATAVPVSSNRMFDHEADTAAHGAMGAVVGTTNTQTLQNKRVEPRIGTTASSSTPTPSADDHDQYNVTALAVNATFAAPTGTPTNGQKLIIRIKDNGTTRTLAYNAIYRAVGVTLPTATTASKTIVLGCIYNSADTKWDVVAVAEEA